MRLDLNAKQPRGIGYRLAFVWAFVMGSVCFLALPAFSGEQAMLRTPKDKVNYAIGVSTIRHFRQYGSGNEMEVDMIIKGMKDEIGKKPLLMNDKELRSVLMAIQTDIMQRKRTARALATMPGAAQRSTGPGTKP
jgi:UDP-GlcNAc:undecaprenyl-phosphate GlcNAc-1-phosphate transferase